MKIPNMDVQWHQIGKVSRDFGITVNRLRGWCDNGLIEVRTNENNTRFIPDTEYVKIKRVVELTSIDMKKVYPTLKDVRKQLQKENLFHKHQEKIEEKREVEKIGQIMEEAFNKPNFAVIFSEMTQGYDQMKNEIKELRNAIETQSNQKFLEGEEFKRKITELTGQNTKIIDSMQAVIDENEALKVLVQDLLKQDVGTMTKKDFEEVLKAIQELSSNHKKNEEKLQSAESNVKTTKTQNQERFFDRLFNK